MESRKFNLADAISMNTANAECPWWNSDCDEEPYADEPVSYQRKCTSWIYHDDGRVEESYYWVPGGIDCVPEFGPWANCTPFDPSC
ncbi:hypothetical protein [Seonamhaeicola sp. S2-3]|uniref:hypothetical protein n=1 Tax=Seonamhaeicola sp. S2-3 TaxID=1936081 RepID=UPI0012F79861|nr:hypothetical protein [Seonamhaeicola sp. S2-3]